MKKKEKFFPEDEEEDESDKIMELVENGPEVCTDENVLHVLDQLSDVKIIYFQVSNLFFFYSSVYIAARCSGWGVTQENDTTVWEEGLEESRNENQISR